MHVAFAAMLFAAAPAAISEMYRWVDDSGTVTYSNEAPPTEARGVTIVDDASNTISTSEKRTLEILNAEHERLAGPSAAWETPGAPGSEALLEPIPSSISTGDAPPQPRAGISPTQSEAVQDPCLRSSDPKCYERNRASYVPYLGYSPTAARHTAAATGVGATSGAAGGGAVGGGAASSPPRLTAPKSSFYALPPGSEAPRNP